MERLADYVSSNVVLTFCRKNDAQFPGAFVSFTGKWKALHDLI